MKSPVVSSPDDRAHTFASRVCPVAPLAEGRTPAESGSAAGSWRHYTLYGLSVRSEIGLPLPEIAPCSSPPAVVFRRAAGTAGLEGQPVAFRRGPGGIELAARYQSKNGEWIRNLNIGVFHLDSNFRCVTVYPDAGVPDEVLGLVLVGQICTFLLAKRGYPCLHASAVTTGGHTAAFVGSHGRGKSTMAACFLARGATLLTDDALPVRVDGETVYGGPGLPMMKLWGDTAEALLPAQELPNLPMLNKKLLMVDDRFPFAEVPAKLGGIFALARYQPEPDESPQVTLTRTSVRDTLTLLLGNTSWSALMTRSEVACILPFYARIAQLLPGYLLRFPAGYQYHGVIFDRVREELARL